MKSKEDGSNLFTPPFISEFWCSSKNPTAIWWFYGGPEVKILSTNHINEKNILKIIF